MTGKTWRVELYAAHRDVAKAYARRREVFRAAHDAGLSLRQIADAAGMSFSTVHRIVGRGAGNGRDDSILDQSADL